MSTKRLESIFVWIALIAGLIMIMIEPPMSCPDERVHFLNAYAVSTGQLVPHVEDGVLKKTFPQNYVQYIDEMTERYAAGNLNEKNNFRDWYYGSWLKEGQTEKVGITYWTIDTNPVAYICAGIAMAIFRMVFQLFSPGLVLPYNLIMVGKMANLVFYICMCYAALRRVPVLKKTMFLLALMPMALYQAASLNYDALLISACFYLFAFICQVVYSYDYEITFRDILSILGIAIILAGVKQAYVFLLLPLFAIPQKCFGSRKRFIQCIALVVITFVVIWGIPRAVIAAYQTNPTDETLAMSEQFRFIMGNPLSVFTTIGASLYKFRGFYLNGFVGILGQLDTNFPLLFHVLFWIAIITVIIADTADIQNITTRFKVLSVIGVILSIIAVFMGIYLLWTSITQGIGADFVDGVQGRYFIPLAPFVMVLLARENDYLRAPRKRNVVQSITVGTGAICVISTVLLLFMRYW